MNQAPLTTLAQCRRHLRQAVIDEFEDLVEGFLKEARKGSCAHMKLAIEVLQPERRQAAATGGGVIRRLREQMEREDTERAASHTASHTAVHTAVQTIPPPRPGRMALAAAAGAGFCGEF